MFKSFSGYTRSAIYLLLQLQFFRNKRLISLVFPAPFSPSNNHASYDKFLSNWKFRTNSQMLESDCQLTETETSMERVTFSNIFGFEQREIRSYDCHIAVNEM